MPSVWGIDNVRFYSGHNNRMRICINHVSYLISSSANLITCWEYKFPPPLRLSHHWITRPEFGQGGSKSGLCPCQDEASISAPLPCLRLRVVRNKFSDVDMCTFVACT